MPTYEYICPDCSNRFKKRRSISSRDHQTACPMCAGARSKRAVSIPMLFSAATPGMPAMPVGPVSPCSSCAATSCGSCGSR